jgi:hypothetical protein
MGRGLDETPSRGPDRGVEGVEHGRGVAAAERDLWRVPILSDEHVRRPASTPVRPAVHVENPALHDHAVFRIVWVGAPYRLVHANQEEETSDDMPHEEN